MKTVPSLTEDAMLWLLNHLGMITTTKLSDCGVTRRARDRLVAAHIIAPVHKNVYRITSAPLTLEARCASLCMAHPRGFITGPTAGRIVGLRRMQKSDVIDLSVPHGLELDLDVTSVRLRQSTKVADTDIQCRLDGINIAAPWRLAFDLAADLNPLDHASIIEQIIHDRMCGIGALRMIAKRLAHPTRPGSALFVQTLANRLPGGALESHPELQVAQALQARGVPVVAQTTWLALPNGRRARIDISAPEVKWGVEVDVHQCHLLLDGTTNDKRRDRQTRMIGWQVDRVTQLDLLDLDTTIDELVTLYEQRCTEFAARATA